MLALVMLVKTGTIRNVHKMTAYLTFCSRCRYSDQNVTICNQNPNNSFIPNLMTNVKRKWFLANWQANEDYDIVHYSSCNTSVDEIHANCMVPTTVHSDAHKQPPLAPSVLPPAPCRPRFVRHVTDNCYRFRVNHLTVLYVPCRAERYA